MCVFCLCLQSSQSPGVGEISTAADGSVSLMTQSSEAGSNDDRRRNSARRSSSSCAEDRPTRSRGAENVCVTVNSPRTNGLDPSPGDRNDLQNVLFLAERDSDNWDSESSSEEDESSGASESDSDSYTQEESNDDFYGTPTGLITDKLRQLASSTYTVSKKHRHADLLQSSPAVECINPSIISVGQQGNEWLPIGGTCEEDSVEVVGSGDSGTVDTVDATAPDAEPAAGCGKPSIVVVSEDGDEWVPRTDTYEKESVAVVHSGTDEPVESADVSDTDGEVLNLEHETYKPANSVILEEEAEEQLPLDPCEENIVEMVGAEEGQTATRECAVSLSFDASGVEELAPGLGSSSNLTENLDGTQLYNADECILNPTLPESGDDVVGAESGTNSAVAVAADLQRISSASLGNLPSNYVKLRALECERRALANAGPSCNVVPAKPNRRLERVDSVNSSVSKPPTYSDGQESIVEKSVGSTHIRVVITAADEDSSSAYYSDAELDALFAEDEGSEGASQRRDSFGSLEGDLWPGCEPNHVFRLARQYSGRVKAMNSSTSSGFHRDFLPMKQKSADESSANDELALSSVQSEILSTRELEDETTMPSEQFAPSSPSASHEMISPWNSTRSRARSVDELAIYRQTNVRDTIRKLTEKASASNAAFPRYQPEPVSTTSESFQLASSNAEDDPEQFTGTSASQKPVRQPGLLVQERLRMLHGEG